MVENQGKSRFGKVGAHARVRLIETYHVGYGRQVRPAPRAFHHLHKENDSMTNSNRWPTSIHADRTSFFWVGILLLSALLFSGCQATHNQPTGQFMDDTGITAAVKSELAGERMSTLSSVEVETVNGVVHLSGVVEDANSKTRAADVARKVDGVTDVKNNLQVR